MTDEQIQNASSWELGDIMLHGGVCRRTPAQNDRTHTLIRRVDLGIAGLWDFRRTRVGILYFAEVVAPDPETPDAYGQSAK